MNDASTGVVLVRQGVRHLRRGVPHRHREGELVRHGLPSRHVAVTVTRTVPPSPGPERARERPRGRVERQPRRQHAAVAQRRSIRQRVRRPRP